MFRRSSALQVGARSGQLYSVVDSVAVVVVVVRSWRVVVVIVFVDAATVVVTCRLPSGQVSDLIVLAPELICEVFGGGFED